MENQRRICGDSADLTRKALIVAGTIGAAIAARKLARPVPTLDSARAGRVHHGRLAKARFAHGA